MDYAELKAMLAALAALAKAGLVYRDDPEG